MRPVKRIAALAALLLAVATVALLWKLHAGNWAYNLPRRAIKMAAIAVTGVAIGLSTVAFQTVVGNRILTPGVMGMESLYLFLQTLTVFALGSRTLALMSRWVDFLLSVGAMVGFSLALYGAVFRGGRARLTFVVLVGMVLGSLFSSLATFMQVLIDPNEFLVVQARMFASFNNINTKLLGAAALMLVPLTVWMFSQAGRLDVMALGRDVSRNLGVDFDRSAYGLLCAVAAMVAVSTALVGPVTFLGLLSANLSYQLLKTYRHAWLMAGAALIALIALIFGQFVSERVFSMGLPISAIINFIGGIYFIALLIREGRR